MENLTLALPITFAGTTGLAVWLFYKAARGSRRGVALLLAWLLLQGAVGLSGFYVVANTLPPRLALLVGPPQLVLVLLLATARGRQFLGSLWLEMLTLLHIVRVPVELVLYSLYLHGAVPRLMTFEGRNWDILAGLTAPVVYYFVFRRKQLGRRSLLVWNLLGMVSLLNIVVNAALSAPTPWQRFAFEQPNVAILHFPFVWLPGGVVPLVLLAHVAALWQLRAASRLPLPEGTGQVALSASAASVLPY